MPFSPDNPNRDRNFVILVLAAVVMFAVIMGGYITLSIADRDTDTYLRFLTTVVLVLVPSCLSAWQAFKAKQNSQAAVDTAQALREDVHNGVLQGKIRDGVTEALNPTTTINQVGGSNGGDTPVRST